ncbi:alpha/beta hydrolase [Niveibacterium umoris]
MHYIEWGDPHNDRVLICVHGLTRNGRDFDTLAHTLSSHYRVICPDVVGRGRSDWLPNKANYGLPQYVSDMMVLIARSGAEQVHWVGTSMGGLIGMAIAAQPDQPIARLVLNDVGPLVTGASLRRIGEYVGRAPVFPDYAAAEAYIRAVSAPFGPLSDDQWRHLTLTSLRSRAEGGFEMIYDPGIGEVFRAAPVLNDVDLWPLYDGIRCPTLVLRGAESDLLTAATHQEMGRRGPQARILEIPGVGHAPMLMDPAQIAPVRDFLLEQ